jgi:putative phage-type endonuclease
MNREERAAWLKERKLGIGGSEVAAIMGLSKYSTPWQVWAEKTGRFDNDFDNEPMYWGRAMEPLIRQRYCCDNGVDVVVPKGILRHPDYDFICASVDGITSDGRLVDIKTSRFGYDFGIPGL